MDIRFEVHGCLDDTPSWVPTVVGPVVVVEERASGRVLVTTLHNLECEKYQADLAATL